MCFFLRCCCLFVSLERVNSKRLDSNGLWRHHSTDLHAEVGQKDPSLIQFNRIEGLQQSRINTWSLFVYHGSCSSYRGTDVIKELKMTSLRWILAECWQIQHILRFSTSATTFRKRFQGSHIQTKNCNFQAATTDKMTINLTYLTSPHSRIPTLGNTQLW